MATMMPITTTTNVTIASSSSTVRDASDVGTYAERIVRKYLQFFALCTKRYHSFRTSGHCILSRIPKFFIKDVRIFPTSCYSLDHYQKIALEGTKNEHFVLTHEKGTCDSKSRTVDIFSTSTHRFHDHCKLRGLNASRDGKTCR